MQLPLLILEKIDILQNGIKSNKTFLNLVMQYGSLSVELEVFAGIAIGGSDAHDEHKLYQACAQALKNCRKPTVFFPWLLLQGYYLMTKSELRQHMIKERLNLSDELIQIKSKTIISRIRMDQRYKKSKYGCFILSDEKRSSFIRTPTGFKNISFFRVLKRMAFTFILQI